MKTGDGSRPLTRLRVRLLLLGLSTSLAVVAVALRHSYLTIVAREDLQSRGLLQYQRPMKVDARRGTIHDRNGRELAESVEVESIYAVPSAFTAEELPVAAEAIGRCLEMPRRRIAARLRGKKDFAWLERKANPERARCVRGLNLAGVGFVAESRRFYPKRRLASQVLGYVGIDNEGMGGVEYALEQQIKGEPGRRIIWTDALKRRAASRVEQRSIPGRSIYLTLDENLQYIAETELATAVRESRSRSGIAILMRPHTGEILAMASFPSFNPNRYGDSPESQRRNRSVTDVYEPGSTFKIVAASAALEEGVTSEDERIDCGNGSIRVADRTIRDHREFDVLTFRDVVTHSSNVGMIRIGQRLGKSRLDAYIKAFGFGEATGVELPGESRGILRPVERWGPVATATITFGQAVSVTPLQMVAATNVIAATGYLMRPKLVLGFGGSNGELNRTLEPEPVRRVVAEKTARRMTEILTEVVERGTGRNAAIAGYRVAGKTGTAQKAVPGGYSRTDFIASFTGFAPANRPEVTALVILDSPEGDHSGSRAASVFARIVERALHYLNVPREDEEVLRFAKLWPQTAPILSMSSAATVREADWPGLAPLGGTPEVLGLPARDALARFVASGLVPAIEGTGFVVEQSPPPGGTLEPRMRARLVLGPKPPAIDGDGREKLEPKPAEAREAVRVAGL
ncbi:MAG: penicillin-binding transpeptidase domain-containing protein [Vicinamibacteria bacterium]